MPDTRLSEEGFSCTCNEVFAINPQNNDAIKNMTKTGTSSNTQKVRETSYTKQMWDFSLLPKISGKWKLFVKVLCHISPEKVLYKTSMSSANCIYVLMYMNLNMQCLRHTNWTTAWSKEMPEHYWVYNFDYQLWRLICMPPPFFSSFVPVAHFKCERKVSSLFFSLKQRSLWEGKQVLWVGLPLQHMRIKKV